uniref:succinyldiaminopimelate transaminase n=1 Tax=Vaginimicrobium propionicum TaxID=1871034 RepID=UPI0009712CB6|nr:succinyldiaminopimelate transaminase [Vaginimicrobium propionicum]
MDKVSKKLPTFPWDTLSEATKCATSHPGGIVDLSVGTPVDPVPQVAIDALTETAPAASGYPQVWGSAGLRKAIINYLARIWNACGLVDDNVLPVMGTKEFVGWLPIQLGIDENCNVIIPTRAYPTYEVGALLAGARVIRCDDPEKVKDKPALIWINYPANPTGAVADVGLVRAWIKFAQDNGAVLASDECYGEFWWDKKPVSILDPTVNDGCLTGLLACHSLSKRSNMAGFRAGFAAGDADLISELLKVRKHTGAMIASPVQAAMKAALNDDEHVEIQRRRYRLRREKLANALVAAGFRIDESAGSIYLWATQDKPCRESVSWLADRGILVAPGDFYGDQTHVRVGLTASDERIEAACARLVSQAG